MRYFLNSIIVFLFCMPVFQVQALVNLKNTELHDLYFGEVMFYAYQGKYFDALGKLDNELSQYYEVDEKELDPLYFHIGQAEFSVGDIELQYRMNQRAGKAIQAVLGDGIDTATRNLAALQLARVFYRKGQAQNVLYALDLIREEPEKSRYETHYSLDVLRGKDPETFKKEVSYLRALAYINTGQFTEAVKLLQTLKNEKMFEGFVHYNLGIALLRSGNKEASLRVFDELGLLDTGDEGLLALKDKANMKLAYFYVDMGDAVKAKKYFERVRLDGPFSNKALLGAGWVEASQGYFDRALIPWTLLHKRNETDAAVQEAAMAVPFAYSKLQAYGNAANLYGKAMDIFAREIHSLDESIKSIRKGSFLQALLDEHGEKDKNWVVNLRNLPESPETRYLLELMASNDFQESYRNYKDLADLRHYLAGWIDTLDAYEELIELRRVYQEPLLPVVEEKFKKIDARMKLRLEQRDNLNTKINNMLISPRPEYLATVEERIALDKLAKIKDYIAAHPSYKTEEITNRIARLDGILLWQIRSEFDQRLTDAYNHLHELDSIVAQLKLRYHSFIRTRQAATQSYEGYTNPIRQLRTRLYATQKKLTAIMAKQGRVIEAMANNELDRRRKRLEEYQIKARFALAESYDRATGSQQGKEIEKLKKEQDKNTPDVKSKQDRQAVTAESIEEQVRQNMDVKPEKNGTPGDIWSGRKKREQFDGSGKAWIKRGTGEEAGSVK